jgi:hypothetical protein
MVWNRLKLLREAPLDKLQIEKKHHDGDVGVFASFACC